MRHFGDSCDIQNVARQIGRMRADDGLRVIAKQRLKIFVPDIAQPICRNKINSHAVKIASLTASTISDSLWSVVATLSR